MGQKVHPVGMRLGFIKSWHSVWYSESKDFADKLSIDIKVRNFIYKKLSHALIGNVRIERPARNAKVIICTARPGVVIGKKGEDVEKKIKLYYAGSGSSEY